ncbi:unnamed protein product [Cochlearia groenlandica]
MSQNTKLVFLTLVLALTLTAATGQYICDMTVDGLSSCEPYVRTKDPLANPEHKGKCCTALSKANFDCLCKAKTKPIPFLSGIDFGLAAKLPGKCGLSGAPC